MDLEKERLEAVAAGRTALASLKEARGMLSSARGWGVYDTIFRGGFISGLIKHSKMDEARDRLIRASAEMETFSRELHDLDLMGINLRTDDFLGIADIIFDGLLADLFMQMRIGEACSRVDMAIEKVEDIIWQLEEMGK